MGNIFKDKVVLIGVTGGIAVYKTVELVSALRKRGSADSDHHDRKRNPLCGASYLQRSR